MKGSKRPDGKHLLASLLMGMITSTKNPRIVNARKLTQRKHRLRQDRFLVEGLQLLAMALDVLALAPAASRRIEPLELFYSQELFTGETAPRLLDQLMQAGAEPVPVAPHVLDTLSERDASQGLAATFSLSLLPLSLKELPPAGATGANSETSGLIVILDKLQDPGNLGTLFRTADAVGVSALILLEPCVDPFDPKTVRGSMGSLFAVPFVRTGDSEEMLTLVSEGGYRLVGAAGRRGVAPWQSDMLIGPVALILGNEARGISPELERYVADYVNLPLRGRAESLNVAVAGGVLMYEWLRFNSKG